LDFTLRDGALKKEWGEFRGKADFRGEEGIGASLTLTALLHASENQENHR